MSVVEISDEIQREHMERLKSKFKEILNLFVVSFRGQDGWIDALERILQRCNDGENILEFAENIRSWYAGMGSFNDICLGETKEEMELFIKLRTKLSCICYEIITEHRGVIQVLDGYKCCDLDD